MSTEKNDFSSWKELVIYNLKGLLGKELDTKENLDFLLPNDSSLQKDYAEGYTPKLCAQLIWADNNLQYTHGRETFLSSNKSDNS